MSTDLYYLLFCNRIVIGILDKIVHFLSVFCSKFSFSNKLPKWQCKESFIDIQSLITHVCSRKTLKPVANRREWPLFPPVLADAVARAQNSN